MSQKVISILDTYFSKLVEIPYDEKILVSPGDNIIFKDSDQREEFGVIKAINRDSTDGESVLKDSTILRPATLNDIQRFENYSEQSKHALDVCKKCTKKYGLDMQVFRASYSFDGSRVMFMFTADQRIDFRELVKDLAKSLQKQIYLRQIGPRDKAKLVGGYGKCGRTLCCSTFLSKLESINMEMVRLQALESKGSSKLSGVCGKLLCCLKYEVEAYKDLRLNMPNISDIVRLKKSVQSPGPDGRVIALDILNKKIKLYFDKEEEYMVVSSVDIEKVMKRAEPVETGHYSEDEDDYEAPAGQETKS